MLVVKLYNLTAIDRRPVAVVKKVISVKESVVPTHIALQCLDENGVPHNKLLPVQNYLIEIYEDDS